MKQPLLKYWIAGFALLANAPVFCACDTDNGGIKLPAGFCASIFADGLGHARQLAVSSEGDVYVNTQSEAHSPLRNAPSGFIVVLRDSDHDGHAETVKRFGTPYQKGKPGGGTGIAIHDESLYVEEYGKILRYTLRPGELMPEGKPQVIVSGLPVNGDHSMHPFAINSDNALYVNAGSASNSCQEKNRELESPGRDPCPELSIRAGIWRYVANMPSQQHSPDKRYVMGARNTVALATYRRVLYAVIQGRDQLSENWPKLYTEQQNNEQPAEVLVRVDRGGDFGWPYCYFDAAQSKYLLAPEYSGDGGKTQGRCTDKKAPLATFPAHWAPEALVFYSGTAFPVRYRDGAFISFHGSWNRAPQQSGFLVAFVPFADGKPSAPYEEFATGFAGAQLPANPKQAAHRPMGLAVGTDGALYVSDDVKGRIWRIVYNGS